MSSILAHISTHLSQIDSNLTAHHSLPNLAKCWCWSWGGGGGGRSNAAVCLFFFPCNVTDKCKICTFPFQKKINDSTLTQAVSSWLISDSNKDQFDSILTRLMSLIFMSDSTLTLVISVRVDSNLIHDSWVEHNPAQTSQTNQTTSWPVDHKHLEDHHTDLRLVADATRPRYTLITLHQSALIQILAILVRIKWSCCIAFESPGREEHFCHLCHICLSHSSQKL